MTIRPCLALLLLAACRSASAAPPAEETLLLIGAPRAVCFRELPVAPRWTLAGSVKVGEVLRELARLGCQRYLVRRELAEQRVTLAVDGGTPSAAELEKRVLAALRAAGIDVASSNLNLVRRAEEEQAPESIFAPPLPSAARHPGLPGEELAAGIDCGEGGCTISRKLLDKLLDDPAAVAAGARVVPAIMEGLPVGLKLYAIRPDSLVGRLGLMNGDTVVGVNEISLRHPTPELGLEVDRQLRKARRLTVHLVRRGKPTTLHIDVR